MLVEHDVEADIVAGLIFVVIAMKQIGGGARIAFAVGQNDAQRPGMIIPGRVIGLLAELINSHGLFPVHKSQDAFRKNFWLLLMREMAGSLNGLEAGPGDHRAIGAAVSLTDHAVMRAPEKQRRNANAVQPA